MALTPICIKNLRDIWFGPGSIWVQYLLLMSKVLFDIDTKTLVKSLIGVLIIEENLSELRESRHSKLRPFYIITTILAIRLHLPHLINFIYLENADRVARYIGFDIYLVMNYF